MKAALKLTALFFAFVLPRAPLSAQEHVDVPLPPYDPPPPASHHGEAHPDQPQPVARPTQSPSKASPRRPSPAKARIVKRSSHPRSHYHAHSHSQHPHPRHRRQVRHRRHSFFHWPWEHRK
jgi:hypothetical protein